MKTLQDLLETNASWSNSVKKSDPKFFEKLAKQQFPKYLWIGCSDSRVPANQIVGMDPGELFVHRNVANLAVHTDFNSLSVLQYAVEALKVEHVIVCGHYGCGGVAASLENKDLGLITNWLRHIQDVATSQKDKLNNYSGQDKVNKLCELNVAHQVMNVCRNPIVQNAWKQKQNLSVHGLIYSLDSGLLNELGLSISSVDEAENKFQSTVSQLFDC